MGKHNANGKKKKKASQLVIRVEKGERDAFVTRCDELDTSAAREIRRFMREWVASHPPAEVQPEPQAAPAVTEGQAAPPAEPVAAAAEAPTIKPTRKRVVRAAEVSVAT